MYSDLDSLIACPSCSRQNFDVIATVNELEARLEDITEPLDVAVIGCVVNGPGEAREVAIGLTGGTPNLLYINGKPDHKVNNDELVDELEKVIREHISKNKNSDEQMHDSRVVTLSDAS